MPCFDLAVLQKKNKETTCEDFWIVFDIISKVAFNREDIRLWFRHFEHKAKILGIKSQEWKREALVNDISQDSATTLRELSL